VAFSFFIIMGDGLPSGQPFPFPEKVIKTGLLLGRISHLTQQAPLKSTLLLPGLKAWGCSGLTLSGAKRRRMGQKFLLDQAQHTGAFKKDMAPRASIDKKHPGNV